VGLLSSSGGRRPPEGVCSSRESTSERTQFLTGIRNHAIDRVGRRSIGVIIGRPRKGKRKAGNLRETPSHRSFGEGRKFLFESAVTIEKTRFQKINDSKRKQFCLRLFSFACVMCLYLNGRQTRRLAPGWSAPPTRDACIFPLSSITNDLFDKANIFSVIGCGKAHRGGRRSASERLSRAIRFAG
jgi:hypothetical protein